MLKNLVASRLQYLCMLCVESERQVVGKKRSLNIMDSVILDLEEERHPLVVVIKWKVRGKWPSGQGGIRGKEVRVMPQWTPKIT